MTGYAAIGKKKKKKSMTGSCHAITIISNTNIFQYPQ